MPDIILKDIYDEYTVYKNVTSLEFDAPDPTTIDTDSPIPDPANTVVFSYGDVQEVSKNLDFSNGDMIVDGGEGLSYSKITIYKPDNLIPQNIKYNVNIGGITGTYKTSGVEKTVTANFTNGDMIVNAESDTLPIKTLTILKPPDLIPENLVNGVNIGGVIGTYSAPSLYPPSDIENHLTDSSIGFIRVYNNTNGQHGNYIQLMTNHVDYGELCIAQKEITDGYADIYANDFDTNSGFLLLSTLARVTGEGFSPSENYAENIFYGLYKITYNTENVNLDNTYNYAYNSDIYDIIISPHEGYYLPKNIIVTDVNGDPINAVINYDNNTGLVKLSPSFGGYDANITVNISAEIMPWLKTPFAKLKGSIVYPYYIDTNADYSILSVDGENVIEDVVDTQEGLAEYNVTETVEGSSYGFILDEEGYYKENTSGGTSRCALSRIDLYMKTEGEVTFSYVHNGYGSNDYGIISNIDCELSHSYSTDISTESENVNRVLKSSNSTTIKTFTMTVPQGQHFIYIKYRRYSSNSGNYYFKYKISTEIPELTSYNIIDYIPHYGECSIGLQSFANGYTESDIYDMTVNYSPEINVDNGILYITNDIPYLVENYNLYIDNKLIGTIQRSEIETGLDLSQYPCNTLNPNDIYITSTYEGNEVSSNIINAWTVSDEDTPIYGVSGMYDANPLLTRTYNAEGLSYTINDDGTVTSDFDNVFPWNAAKNVSSRGYDDIENHFVQMPEMYFKVGTDNNYRITDLAVSPKPHSDGEWHKVEPFCYGKYTSWTYNAMHSVGGGSPYARTKAVHRSAAKLNGTNYHMNDLYHRTVMQFLWWIEWGTKNVKSILDGAYNGSGTSGGNTYIPNGITDSITTPTGFEPTRNAMRWHYIENFVGGYSEYVDGVYLSALNTQSYATSDPLNYSDTNTNMNQLAYSNPSTNYCIAAYGWDNNNPFLCIPCESTDSADYSQYFCCRAYGYSSSYSSMLVGTNYNWSSHESYNGFNLRAVATSASYQYYQSRLLYLGEIE